MVTHRVLTDISTAQNFQITSLPRHSTASNNNVLHNDMFQIQEEFHIKTLGGQAGGGKGLTGTKSPDAGSTALTETTMACPFSIPTASSDCQSSNTGSPGRLEMNQPICCPTVPAKNSIECLFGYAGMALRIILLANLTVHCRGMMSCGV